MNLEAPIFRNKDFRKAMQYLFNFERAEPEPDVRRIRAAMTSFFEGSEYANPNLKPYGFDPAKAREHLARAGYRRPAETAAQSWPGAASATCCAAWSSRAPTATTCSSTNAARRPASRVIYGSKGLERHLTVMQQEFRRAGVDMRLRLLEPGTAFERGLERKYEMTVTGRTTGFYPQPRQYLHTEFKNATNNNNIWGFGTAEVDELIAHLRARPGPREAPQGHAPHRRDRARRGLLHSVLDARPTSASCTGTTCASPSSGLPRRTEQLNDYMVYWIDPQRRKALEEAMRSGTALPLDPVLDKDYYGIRAKASGRRGVVGVGGGAMTPLLEIDHLQVGFDTEAGLLRAVDGVSMSVEAGQTLGVVGESGCGKSVTAASMLRLVPSPPGVMLGGAIRFDGRTS